MSLPNVRIILQNGQLGGLVAFAEGVAGIIGTGVAVAGKIGLGDPRLVFSLQDALDLGITLADNPVAYRHVKEFYDEAGTGAELYIMLVPDTMTQTVMWDTTNASGAKKLLNYAQGRIRIATSFFTPNGSYTLDDSDGLDADVFTAILKADQLANEYAQLQTPLRVVLEGRAFNDTPADLLNLRTMTNNRVGVMVGSTSDNGTASVGLVLGRLASVPPQRKISRVKDGGLNIIDAYVGSIAVASYLGLELMNDKGYIVMRTFPGITGFFFNGDPTCAPATDDYSMIARGRVIDKAQVIAYATYVEELDDEVLVDAAGKLDVGLVKYLETKMANQINGSMTANREISSVSVRIDPAQNILSTNKLAVVMKIIPVGYASVIEVALGFDNPNS